MDCPVTHTIRVVIVALTTIMVVSLQPLPLLIQQDVR